MAFLPSDSKVLPPRLPAILNRDRLMERLLQDADKRLICIVGQPAQGKSTLAACYANASHTPVAWINLDRDDSDAVNLFHLMAQALQHARGQDRPFTSPQLFRDGPRGPREDVPVYAEWGQVLYEGITDPVHIVLDGLDRLTPDASSFQFLRVLLDHAPENVRLIMVSRKLPPLDIEARRMRGEAGILTNEELAFTLDEVKEYFRTILNMSLPIEEIEAIHRITNGWIGSIVLLSESLRRRGGKTEGKTLLEEVADSFPELVFRYLGDEVFYMQTPETRDFLLKCSFLDIIEPGMAATLTGIDKAWEILDRLARDNLFVQAVCDKKKGCLFRLHQLLRDFLQARLKTAMNAEARKSLYYRAASLYEDRREPEEAVKYYLRAEAHSEAASVIERIGDGMLKTGRVLDLSRWLGCLPREIVEKSPWLLFYLSMARRFSGSGENAHNFCRAFTLFESQGDLRGQLLSIAHLIEASYLRGCDTIPVTLLLERAEKLLQSLSSYLYPYERAVLWSMMGLGYNLRDGNPRKGYWASRNADLIACDLGDGYLQVEAISRELESLAMLGEFPMARQVMERLERITRKRSFAEHRSLYCLHASLLPLLTGDTPKAVDMILTAREEAERLGLIYLYPVCLLYLFLAKRYLGQFSEVEEMGRDLLILTESMGNWYLYGLTLFFLGQSCYFKRDMEKAAAWLDRSISFLSSDEAGSVFHLMAARVVRGLVCTHVGNTGTVEEDLRDVLDYYQRIGCRLLMVDVHLAMSLFTWKQGRTKEAADALGAGFGIAREEQYAHFMLISRHDLAKGCVLALELGVRDAEEYAAHILRTRLAGEAGPELDRLSRHPDGQIAAKAWWIRAGIHRAAVPQLTIKTLGGFVVYRGETPVREEEWQASQPKLLLKALVSRGFRWVEKDLLLEDLWPEGSPTSSERNFKVILHRLRKILEPQMQKDFGSSYLHLKANVISMDEEHCRVDVDEFIGLIERGNDLENGGDTHGALSLYEQALACYKGDFLPEDLYRPWAEAKRKELRRACIELLFRVAALHEARRSAVRKAVADYRCIIGMDPLKERAYQRLMVIYSDRGMWSAALSVYEECREALREGLGVPPDPLTVSLYRRIVESMKS